MHVRGQMDMSKVTNAAAEFIRKSSRAGKPFFLYVPHSMPHRLCPQAAPSAARAYAGCMEMRSRNWTGAWTNCCAYFTRRRPIRTRS
jgi:hypothetical protein